MRPRLGPIVETEHGFDDGFELFGYLNHTLPAAIGSTRVLVALQLDAEGLTELCHGPREHDGAPRRMLLHDAEPIHLRECFHRGQIRTTRPVRRSETRARQWAARSIRTCQARDMLCEHLACLWPHDHTHLEPLVLIGKSQCLRVRQRASFASLESTCGHGRAPFGTEVMLPRWPILPLRGHLRVHRMADVKLSDGLSAA